LLTLIKNELLLAFCQPKKGKDRKERKENEEIAEKEV
jgi:hypothetical protein